MPFKFDWQDSSVPGNGSVATDRVNVTVEAENVSGPPEPGSNDPDADGLFEDVDGDGDVDLDDVFVLAFDE